MPVPLAGQVGATWRVLADGRAPQAVANDPSAATVTAPPRKRRRDQRCAAVSVTISGTSADGRPGSPAVGSAPRLFP